MDLRRLFCGYFVLLTEFICLLEFAACPMLPQRLTPDTWKPLATGGIRSQRPCGSTLNRIAGVALLRAMLDPKYRESYAFRAGEVAEWLKAAVC